MKDLAKAIEDYERAKVRMEKAKARYEADLKKFRAAEAAKTEAENLTIVMTIRESRIPLSQLKEFTRRMKNGMSVDDILGMEEEFKDDESGENEEKQREEGEAADGEDTASESAE